MEFEELQVIWNTQNAQPLYGFNEDGLQKMLRNKSRQFRQLIFWQQVKTYGSSGFMISSIAGLLFLNTMGMLGEIGSSRTLFKWEIAALLVAVVCWFQFAITTFLTNQRLKRHEGNSVKTLRDELAKEIEHTSYQIKLRSHIMRGFLPPYVGTAIWISVIFGVSGIPRWSIIPILVFMVVALIIESDSQRRFVEREMVPRLHELESLRDKLTAPSMGVEPNNDSEPH